MDFKFILNLCFAVWYIRCASTTTQKPQNIQNLTDNKKIIEFRGCGFLYNYYLGIIKVLQKELCDDNIVFSGMSAGIVPAILMALNLDADESWDNINVPILNDINNYWSGAFFCWNNRVHQQFMDILPDDVHLKLNHKIRLSVTQLPSCVKSQNHVIDKFESKQDLVDGVIAGAFIPVYDTKPFYTWRGMHCIDGAFTTNYADADNKFVIYPERWRDIPPQWYILSGDETWARQLRQWGERDATKHIYEFTEFLQA